MLKYIKNYRFRSIFLQNMCMIVVLLLLPFLITLFLLKDVYNHMLEAEQKKYTETISSQMVSNTNGIMQELYSKMLLLQGDKDVKLFAYADENNASNVFYGFSDITDMLQVMVRTSNCIKDIKLHAAKSGDIISQNGLIAAQKEEILNEFSDVKNVGIYYSIGEDINTSKLFIYYVLNQKRSYRMTIIYEMDIRCFTKNICGENKNPVELMLNGQKVWANKEISANDKVKYTCVEKELDTADMILRIYFEEDADIFRGVTQLWHISILGLVAMILLSIWLLSIRMYAPVRTIMTTLENYDDGVFLDSEGSGLLEDRNELEYILNTFYQETGKKQHAERELNERIIMMKKAQMVALQAQINPHFIFNTLDTINWMATKHLGKRNEVSVMTSNLAKMIRLFGENANTLISLEEEMAYVSIYVKIMEVRCENKFSLQWDVPESLRQYKVVKLMLQPLVENAINHGALPLKESSVIHVRAYVQEGILCISVKDQGPGIKEQDLEKLRNVMENEILRADRHFGLSNVNRRLRIMFGEKSGVSIESKLECGTEVIIAIPIENCVGE